MTSPVSLVNCDHEPIHIPGLIQPHGALLAFGQDGVLQYTSANADVLLRTSVMLHGSIDEQMLPAEVCAQIKTWLNEPHREFESYKSRAADFNFEVVGHRNPDGLMIVEFESILPSVALLGPPPPLSIKSIQRLRRQKTLTQLLDAAVNEIRMLTGFDRVAAYSFRDDDSGEVVTESRRADLEDWVGLRYPASDIPMQARRLYVLNTLRLIANVKAVAVDIVSAQSGNAAPLDMSFCGLRSVSPIHIEYLKNIGVAASMSVSIVIDGKLWGLVACHHMQPRYVPYGVRVACEVLAQILSMAIGNLETAAVLDRVKRAGGVLKEIVARTRSADDLLVGLASARPNPADIVDADVTICLWSGESMVCNGPIPAQVLQALAPAIAALEQGTVISAKLSDSHSTLSVAAGHFSGMLAMCFDVPHAGWVVWLRREQIEQVRWAGKPEKIITTGPNGPRLTPRGSFAEWQEVVRGSSTPWHRSEIETAESLRLDLSRIAGAHAIRLESMRLALLAAIGHDLRDPLNSISLAAQILQTRKAEPAKLGIRIHASAERMSRLITQILDMTKLKSVSGFQVMYAHFDLSQLIHQVVEESNFGHPDTAIAVEIPHTLMIFADRDRLSQVLSNLVSNARHHGTRGTLVTVFARQIHARTYFGVSNDGAPIAPKNEAGLFRAFKPRSGSNTRNRTGLGLGLYIASEIIKSHGGVLSYSYDDGVITFTAEINARDEQTRDPAQLAVSHTLSDSGLTDDSMTLSCS